MESIRSIINKLSDQAITLGNYIKNLNYTKVIDTGITESLDNSSETFHEEINKRRFMNLPPKIGYFDETTIPIVSAFNMAVDTNNFWVISDFQGREMMYYPAQEGYIGTSKVFSAYRMTVSSSFLYDNQPCIPGYMNEGRGDYIISISGLGSDYMVAYVKFNGTNAYHLINTNYTGSANLWTSYIDVTSIFSNLTSFEYLYPVMYFREYNTLVFIGSVREDFYEEIFNVSSKAKISSKILMSNIYRALKAQNPEMYRHYGTPLGTAVYNKYAQQLIIMTRDYIYRKVGTTNSSQYHELYYKFNIPINHFKTGSGTYTNILPDSGYKIFAGNQASMCTGGDTGIRTCTYDDITQTIRFIWRYQQQMRADMFTTSAQDLANAPVPLLKSKARVTYDIQSTDAAPWAKLLGMPFIIGEYTYLYCYSKKYSYQYAYVEYKINESNNIAILQANSWWTVSETGNSMPLDRWLFSYKNSSSSYTWYTLSNYDTVKKITFSDFIHNGINKHGKILYSDTSFPKGATRDQILSVNSSYSISGGFYHPGVNRFFYWVTKGNGNPPGYPAILEYNPNTKTFKEHTSWAEGHINCINASYDALGSSTGVNTSSNWFIDTDNSFYFRTYYSSLGGSGGSSVTRAIYNTSNSTISMEYITAGISSSSYPSTFSTIGYSNKHGYFYGWCLSGYGQYNRIYCGKHPVTGTNSASTMYDLLKNGKYNTLEFRCASAIGMASFIQDFVIFLGGYYNVVPAQEIALYPNATNYIYLYRSSNINDKVQVEVRTSPITADGFNRILCSKIVTTDTGPRTQEDIRIKNYG